MSHCVHHGACGGCAADLALAANKAERLRQALIQAGFPNPPMAPLVEVPPRSRRRVDLAATRGQDGAVTLGLHRARGHEVVDMTMCVLLEPRLFALLAPLRVLLRSLQAFRRTGSVIVNWLDNGPDVLLRLDAEATMPDRARLIAFARAENAPRISIARADSDPEPVAVLAPPTITFAGVPVQPAPGAFLQASAAGEAAIIAAVLAGLPKLTAKSRIVELYAGIGTITFPLSLHARVEAYEGAPPAVAALDAAARRANLAGRVTTHHRDLTRRPLLLAELTARAALILNPPYTGAAPQLKNLAAAKIPRIIYISCNPETLSPDAATLHHHGYKLQNATPIDQFPHSENLESVVVFQ